MGSRDIDGEGSVEEEGEEGEQEGEDELALSQVSHICLSRMC